MNKFKETSQDNASKGQILISILIGIAVFSILIHTVFTLIRSSFELVGLNRARVTARHLAQEKIENIRNMNYDDIGTIGGIPNGVIPAQEIVEKNDIEMTVSTSIIYVDDPFDDTAPNDLEPEDYKRVRVEIFWEGLNQNRNSPIVFITDIAPSLLTSSSGGTLVILVFDANGNPVSQASVHIYSDSLDPIVDTTVQTNAEGEVILPGATPCTECYQITVTKEGFSTDRTYSTSEVTSPTRPHASILIGDITQVSFAIDQTSTLNIASKDSRENNFIDIGNIPFRIRGEKIIGYGGSGSPIYKYDQTHTTDGSGNIILDDMEWDVYRLIMPETSVYTISGTNPLLPIVLLPDSNINQTFSVVPYSQHSLLSITKNSSQNKLEDIFVRLTDGGSYDESTTSGKLDNPDFGQVIFSNLDDTTTYTIEATASGYLDYSSTISILDATVYEIIMQE